jgi:hypothetical protein
MAMALKGFVGFVSKYQMRGWAYFPEAAAEHVRVSVECDGAAVAAGVANLFREDLAHSAMKTWLVSKSGRSTTPAYDGVYRQRRRRS